MVYRQKSGIALASLLAIVALCSGCGERLPELVYLPDQVQPVPATNLPVEMRVKNWTGRNQWGQRGGSCVHASAINVFRAIGRPDLEMIWYQNRDNGYEGGETGNGIVKKFKRHGIPHIHTESADVSLLEAASATHRPGLIFYYPSHCVNFQEFATLGDGREVAVLLDNNFPDRYIIVDRRVFERSWKYYDGFALVPWLEPVTPRTYPRTVPVRST